MEWVNAISACLAEENGQNLSNLLRLNSNDHLLERISYSGHSWEYAVKKLDSPWSDICSGHVKVLKSLSIDNVVSAFAEQNLVAQQFHQAATGLTRWVLPVLYVINLDLRRLAVAADAKLRENGQKASSLEDCARTMNKAFSICATDRFSTIEKSRKWGAFFVCNLLFQTYFKLKQVNLATNLIRSLNSADLPDLAQYPIGHVVTFKYYVGVLAFYNEQYTKAEDDLNLALQRCRSTGPDPSIYQNNRIRILNYLIPLRLIAGRLPDPRLFKKYPVLSHCYAEIVDAVVSGNLGRFDDILEMKQRILIARGTYLTVERCRSLCFRNLAKKVWICKDKSTRIEFDVFLKAVRFVGVVADMDEVECMLANLIDKGYLKGYMSREKATLVLSPSNAFPQIGSIS